MKTPTRFCCCLLLTALINTSYGQETESFESKEFEGDYYQQTYEQKSNDYERLDHVYEQVEHVGTRIDSLEGKWYLIEQYLREGVNNEADTL